jgi:hypothetical protein
MKRTIFITAAITATALIFGVASIVCNSLAQDIVVVLRAGG